MTAVGPTVAAEVLDRISEDELVELTRALVQVPGANPPGLEAATVALLADQCRARGLMVEETEVAPGRSNLVARLPAAGAAAGRPGLLLLGHTDVVPPGEGWTDTPFSGALRDGRVHGRGSADMRGGLAACLVAIDAVRRAGVPLDGPVELAALVDEEDLGLGIRAFMAAGAGPWRGCLVAEPTSLQTVIACRGDSYLDYRVHGRPAHSGTPDQGRNAIAGAARLAADLERWHRDLAATPHPLVGPATVSLGTVSGGEGISIVAAECRLGVDRRLLPEEDPAVVLADAHRRLAATDLGPDISADVTMTMAMPGFATAPGDPFVRTVDDALARAGGPGLPLGGWTAACDGGFVATGGTPVVVLGPGSVTEDAHRADESVAVADLLVAARTYALVILGVLGSAPRPGADVACCDAEAAPEGP